MIATKLIYLVSIPQAVGTVATDKEGGNYVYAQTKFQYRKR